MTTEYTKRTSRPVLAVVAGSGQVARSARDAGADLLFALNAGLYRSRGHGSLPSFLPFGNANAQTRLLLKTHILPVAGSLPVVAGAQAGDPGQPLPDLLAEYRTLGVHGICNWPAVGFLDGALRAIRERSGKGTASELAMLKHSRDAGFRTYGFVFTPEEARAFADAGIDVLILHLGLTRMPDEVHSMRDMLQLNQSALRAMMDAARSGSQKPACLGFGGSITEPDDLEELLRHCPLDGFAGGSVFERIPVTGILDSTVRRFKSVMVKSLQDRAEHTLGKDGGSDAPGLGPILGRSPLMQKLFRTIRRVAPFDVSVYVEGESGVGKELVAIQLHQHNRRAGHPFVTVNCGAIPDGLLESELFGHEKGSFTGADRKRLGKFELAQHGTLFLDEVADLSAHGQVALLRALQQREITRVGGDQPIPLDVRIVAASNQPLQRLVDEGRFRPDLYHRLNNITLWVPPLRERLEDLPILIEDTLARLQVQLGRRLAGVTPRFLESLRRHFWPGNVRELQHVLTQAALLEDNLLLEGKEFTPGTAPRSPQAGFQVPQTHSAPHWEEGSDRLPMQLSPEGVSIKKSEAARRALANHGGNKSRAAAALGVTRKTLYAWLEQP
ncbi:MAG: phosphoenolpyruvate hydrolase family protein [Fibrobacteria bacterium]